MSTASLNAIKQIETLQVEALESCSNSAKKVLLEIAIEKTQALKEIINNQPLFSPYTAGLTIGDRIQLARESLGMSYDDLAEKLDIHPGGVLAWEDGDDQPMAGMVIPLANALKCDPMWLLTGESRHESSGCAETPQAPVKVTQGVDMHGIGKRIRKARVDKRMYTEELENAIGADEGEVFRWETEKTVPPALYIDKLAKVLDVSVTWLLTGKEVEVSHG
ncbi:hypothetical protein APP90_21460 [Salmonella enterica subsp. enterica serovar Sandiego]|uniref:helix-turn-helix domain-containing protein n=1 Tax=Salmonella enterica TaxID=28901 RepID=UPI0008FC1E9C|nr:helix-turn-helix domain-containing protein [Salmonella enterica]EAN3293045.1 helix-turn-helix domain-containing protein [Salmonella enterica subsp. enterica serovar Oranienburg]ECC9953900.1 helix-turn-helix domain-containing protein [Salmonella enterica subsp. enterica]EDV3468791.1 helix-turn-helix domain-containing protein [Salmonella enterica subsp. enterica serovar Poona]EHK3757976.1 helix-turn-helix domain-containing protein [Salmonella enterica]EJI6167498.1 helix-turn-helix domain-cont